MRIRHFVPINSRRMHLLQPMQHAARLFGGKDGAVNLVLPFHLQPIVIRIIGEIGRQIAGMRGRSRTYDLSMTNGSQHAAVGIAVSHRCDLLVAVAQGRGAAAAVQRAALEFLATSEMTRWMISAMGGD